MPHSDDRSTSLLAGSTRDPSSSSLYSPPSSKSKSSPVVISLVVALLAAFAVIGGLSVALLTHDNDNSAPTQPAPSGNLSSLITAESVYVHLQGLQRAADIGNASRRTDTAGYNASLAYVQSVLQNLESINWNLQPWTLGTTKGVNIVATTLTGDPHNTITVGGHLDSVYSGLNDDGSGSSAVLALAVAVDALVMSKQLTLVNKIRFMWFDKEENGLIGSRAAIQLLIDNNSTVGDRLEDQVAMLNGDMLGSPNFIMGILDGRNLPARAGEGARAGSAVLVNMFMAEFAARGWPYKFITSSAYMQGSDQWSYWAQGVPAAILFSGVSEIHTEDDVAKWGGVLGVAADPCYHRTCDNILNVNPIILSRLTSMYGSVLQQLAVNPNVRTFLNITTPNMTLAPSLQEMITMDRAEGKEVPDMFTW